MKEAFCTRCKRVVYLEDEEELFCPVCSGVLRLVVDVDRLPGEDAGN